MRTYFGEGRGGEDLNSIKKKLFTSLKWRLEEDRVPAKALDCFLYLKDVSDQTPEHFHAAQCL